MQAAAVSGTLHHPCMAIVFGCILLCSQKVFAEDAFRTHHHHHAKILHEDHATADSGCGYSGAKIVFTSLYGATAKAPWLNCAVESAMLKKGNDGVVVLTDNVEEFTASWPNSLPSPAVLVDIKSCFANTPLQPWLDSPQLASALFRQQNIADALRLAVIYKNGGTYLDLDIIALQDKAFSLAGALSAQKACTEGCEEGWLNNAYLSFPPQHPFMYQLLIAFVLKFEGSLWGHGGPVLVSTLYSTLLCADPIAAQSECAGVDVLPAQRLSPVGWTDAQQRLSSMPSQPEFDFHDPEVWAVHVYHSAWNKTCIPRPSVLAEILLEHCPTVSMYSSDLIYC
ncbi:TPA: Lactosylceramide 4-alpha-galactosyltransferase [Trebouxia sp. C0005]